MKTKLFFCFVTLLIVCSSCKKQDIGTPGPNEVWMVYQAYNPIQLQVKPGTTVTFTNKDNADHTASSTNSTFDSEKISSGNSYTYKFNTVGNYYFYCKYHSSNSSEQGVIIVK